MVDAIESIEIAATYKEAIDLNKVEIEQKVKHYNLGLNFMFWGLIVFSVHFVVEEIIKHANDKKKPSVFKNTSNRASGNSGAIPSRGTSRVTKGQFTNDSQRSGSTKKQGK